MKKKTVKLGRFREDPDNVSEATDEEIARLAEKLRRSADPGRYELAPGV